MYLKFHGSHFKNRASYLILQYCYWEVFNYFQYFQDDVDSHLPRLVSLFTSSSGEKLYQYMFLFSKYVLMRVTQQENGLYSDTLEFH